MANENYIRQHTVNGDALPLIGERPPAYDVASFVLERMLDDDDRVVVQMADDPTDRITRHQWVAEALRLRRAIAKYISAAEDITMLASANSSFFGVAVHAALLAGRFSALQVDKAPSAWPPMLSVARPKVILVERKFALAVAEAVKQVDGLESTQVVVVPTHFRSTTSFESVVVGKEERLLGLVGYDEFIGDDIGPENLREELLAVRRPVDASRELAVLLFSSGTTGPAKAFCLTHAECWRGISAM